VFSAASTALIQESIPQEFVCCTQHLAALYVTATIGCSWTLQTVHTEPYTIFVDPLNLNLKKKKNMTKIKGPGTICLQMLQLTYHGDADGADCGDADGAQLGNVDIATAGHQVLSHKMLKGLQAAIQERLSRYATGDIQTDTAALARLRAHANG